MHLFTPYASKESADRVEMKLNDEDNEKIITGRRWRADVTDQSTGRRYHVRGCACTIPRCFCAAEVVKELVV